jgi:hypothetical protein
MHRAKLHRDWELLPRPIDSLVGYPAVVRGLKLDVKIPK